MARPREFEETSVLEKAMEVFWKRGYRATSIEDLVAVTGLKKGSLYAAFHDKDTLFKRTLEHYEQTMGPALPSSEDPIADLRIFFDQLVRTSLARNRSGWGCFLMNTSMELEGRNDDLAIFVRCRLKAIEACFSSLLSEADRLGHLKDAVDIKKGAQVLLGAAFSIRGLSRSQKDRQLLNSIVDGAFYYIT